MEDNMASNIDVAEPPIVLSVNADTTQKDGNSTNNTLPVEDDATDRLLHNNSEPQKSNSSFWLVFFLRLFLSSPIKWKKNSLWISVYHLVWLAVFIAKLTYLTKLTFQIGHCRENVSSSINDGHIALHHTLLRHWDASFETLPYPPSTGKFAVYNMQDMQERINFAVENVYNAEVTATGFFRKLSDDFVRIEVDYFDLTNNHDNHSFKNIVTNIQRSFEPHYGLSEYTDDHGNLLYKYNITKDLVKNNMSSVLDRMMLLKVMFSLHTLRVSRTYDDSRCQHTQGNVTFNDDDHNGQVLVYLDTNTLPIKCAKMNYSLKDSPQCRHYNENIAKHVKAFSIVTVVIDIVTFIGGIVTLFATFIYMITHYSAIYGSESKRKSKRKNLPYTEYLCNVKLWKIPSVAADILTLIGVDWILSTLGDENDFEQPLQQWDKHVVYLGSGCLLTWFSLLRFLKINNKFTLLFKTLKKSAVDIIFFLICVTIIFMGFLFCTYIVLGPYHVKFQQPSTTAEALFSMINGDEIYVSFALLQAAYSGDDKRIILFSRLIIYGFVTIFTVFVLNLLIALFNSAYEVVKESYEQQQKDKDSVPETLSYFMFKDLDDCATSGNRYCKVSHDEDKSLIRCKTCTCGLFNYLVHCLCCNIFAVFCCCHCKKRHQN